MQYCELLLTSETEQVIVNDHMSAIFLKGNLETVKAQYWLKCHAGKNAYIQVK